MIPIELYTYDDNDDLIEGKIFFDYVSPYKVSDTNTFMNLDTSNKLF